ncbi:MAG: hypothetical protein K9G33_04820 [Sneathiella sp.]|nr:hypothetical protein [Sneathiella sp.]
MTLMTKILPARRILALLALLTPLLLTGCQEDVTGSIGNLFSSSEDEKEVINVVSLKPQEVPWHVQSAVAATVLRLQDEDPAGIDGKFSVIGSGGIATDDNINLKGFGVENVQINDLFHPKEAPELTRLGARLILVDPAGRRVGISFVADYELSEGQVVLKGHDWAYIRAEAPLAETYIVPTAAIEALDEKTARNYTAFRSHILTNAVVAGDPKASKDMGDYTIVTFVMDHLIAGDKFELRLSDVKEGTEGFTEDSRYIVHDNGWVTGIVPGKFSLAGDKAFWVKAVYTPKKKEDGGFFSGLLNTGQLIGLFNTANLKETSS